MKKARLSSQELFALQAVRRGCNTNKKLIGASYVQNFGTDKEKEISYYDALKIIDEIIEEELSLQQNEGTQIEEESHKDKMYLKLTHKSKELKGKEGFNYHLYGEFPYSPGVTPDTALSFLGLQNKYTAIEITKEEYEEYEKKRMKK